MGKFKKLIIFLTIAIVDVLAVGIIDLSSGQIEVIGYGSAENVINLQSALDEQVANFGSYNATYSIWAYNQTIFDNTNIAYLNNTQTFTGENSFQDSLRALATLFVGGNLSIFDFNSHSSILATNNINISAEQNVSIHSDREVYIDSGVDIVGYNMFISAGEGNAGSGGGGKIFIKGGYAKDDGYVIIGETDGITTSADRDIGSLYVDGVLHINEDLRGSRYTLQFTLEDQYIDKAVDYGIGAGNYPIYFEDIKTNGTKGAYAIEDGSLAGFGLNYDVVTLVGNPSFRIYMLEDNTVMVPHSLSKTVGYDKTSGFSQQRDVDSFGEGSNLWGYFSVATIFGGGAVHVQNATIVANYYLDQ